MALALELEPEEGLFLFAKARFAEFIALQEGAGLAFTFTERHGGVRIKRHSLLQSVFGGTKERWEKGAKKMNNLGYTAGWAVGIVIGLVIAAFAVRYCRSGREHSRSRYDERQKIAMGKAYRDGFWALLAAVILSVILTKIPGAGEHSEMFFTAACFIGLSVYIVGCIIRDAYMGINDKAKRWTVVLAAIGIINLVGAAGSIRAGGLENGWLNLLAGALILVALAAYGIRYAVKNREREED